MGNGRKEGGDEELTYRRRRTPQKRPVHLSEPLVPLHLTRPALAAQTSRLVLLEQAIDDVLAWPVSNNHH